MTDADTHDDIFPAAYRAAQQEQASRLKAAAEKAGLRFDDYLAPGDAPNPIGANLSHLQVE